FVNRQRWRYAEFVAGDEGGADHRVIVDVGGADRQAVFVGFADVGAAGIDAGHRHTDGAVQRLDMGEINAPAVDGAGDGGIPEHVRPLGEDVAPAGEIGFGA